MVILLMLPVASWGSQAVINEFLASNAAVNADEDGQYTDWLELYNSSEVAVDLTGYTLTDDPAVPARWSLPATVLEPHGFLVIWASGKDRSNGLELHANFKLDRDGEFIGLYAPAGDVVDSLSYGAQTTDIAWGRMPDGGATLVAQQPTPGTTNPNQVSVGELSFLLPQGNQSVGSTVELVTDLTGGEIHYTIDGTTPTATSTRYTTPIPLTETELVRARVFVSGVARTSVVSRLYLIDEPHDLPVLAIATDPDNLWDPDIGIMVHYEERGLEWEREGQISLIEDGLTTRFAVGAGIRVHGGWNRQLEKKSLRLYFRSEYGTRRLEYPVFDDGPASYDRLLLHSGSEDHPLGFETWTLIREALSATLAPDNTVLTPAFRPVALYLNEVYWGVYWLRERLDDDFVETNMQIAAVDLLENSNPPITRAGDLTYWNESWSFISTFDPTDPIAYSEFETQQVDVDNYIDYNIQHIFAANWDWPQNNNFRYHDRSGSHPWRWILWDIDNAWVSELPITHDTVAWAIRDEVRTDLAYAGQDSEEWLWSTLILRKLLENDGGRIDFLNRFADLLNTTLSTENVTARIDALQQQIGDEVPREIERWAEWVTLSDWYANLDLLRDFAEQRPGLLRTYLVNSFDLDGIAELTLLPAEGVGEIRVSSLTPTELPWTGSYFQGVPITITITAAEGYVLSGWNVPELPADETISLTLAADLTLQPEFERLEVAVPPSENSPRGFALGLNVPNPFNPRTMIQFNLPQSSDTRLEIYNPLGAKVRTLLHGYLAPGAYHAVWDGKADSGKDLPSGVYYYRLQTRHYDKSRGMILVR